MWEKLEPILRKACDDKEYLLGIRSLLPTEDNKKELFEAIKAGLVAKDADEITMYALAINQDAPFEE